MQVGLFRPKLCNLWGVFNWHNMPSLDPKSKTFARELRSCESTFPLDIARGTVVGDAARLYVHTPELPAMVSIMTRGDCVHTVEVPTPYKSKSNTTTKAAFYAEAVV